MDFPYSFSVGASFVTNIAEVKQSIYEVLTNFIGTFLQNNQLGSGISLHTGDTTLLEIGIQSSLSQIRNVTYDHCEIEKDDTKLSIRVYVKYDDVDLTITYSDAN